MKKIMCVLTFLLSFIMCGVDCYGAEIEKDISVNAKTEVIMEGIKEGVRVTEDEIKVEMDDGTIIRAQGDFEDTIRLMVMPIKKSMKKEWDWLQKATKKIGINKSAYDIFFVNSSGVRVDAGKGSQISVMSRDRIKDINVYFIESDGVQSKLKSKIEEYVVKFRMVRNGYYTLVIANDNKAEFSKDDESIKDVTKKDENKENTNKEDSEKNKENVKNEDSNKEDDDKENIDKEDETEDIYDNTDKKIDGKQNSTNSKSKKEETNLSYIFLIIGVFFATAIIFIIILFKKKKEDEDDNDVTE